MRSLPLSLLLLVAWDPRSAWAHDDERDEDRGHEDKVRLCHKAGPRLQLVDVASRSRDGHDRHGDREPLTFWADRDGDGYGNRRTREVGCVVPPGYVTNGSDCNDAEPTVHPNAPEACNRVDDDCDARIDEGDIGDRWYADQDIDGFGSPSGSVLRCSAPVGYTAQGGDCNDLDAAVNPNASETCSPVDDDCDGQVNEADALDAATWYEDGDLDGYGDANFAQSACEAPVGWVANADDCVDADPAIHPEALEVCDGEDGDCDGEVDEDAVDALTWYVDFDLDGAGDPDLPLLACEAPPGSSADPSDCDDQSAETGPDATEWCDGIDDDCDGIVDEPDAVDAPTWYADLDLDGHGDPLGWAIACVLPAGFVAGAGDCDDTTALVGPDVLEVCNTFDDDCDGAVDEAEAVDALTWYVDADGDQVGDALAATAACAQPAGHAAVSGDCDDGNAAVHPGALEICDDGLDQTCEGDADEGCEPPVLATFPLEVIGPNGTIVSMTLPLSDEDALRPTLYLQIHDLDYDGEGAFRLNDGPWWSLQDEQDPGDPGAVDVVHVEVLGEAAAGYGGLGGLFGTLKLEVDLPPGALRAGDNTLSFQFVHTDGVTSGFRVLDVDLRDDAGVGLFPDEAFGHADPNDWAPIYTDPASIAEGERLWRTAALTEPLNGPMAVHCADCHLQDGRDLKYFGYSDHSIVERAKFHELSQHQGELIASFIRTRPGTSPGRPWNPPFQPGPGTDDKPVDEWAAGAGIDWVLDEDEDTIDHVFPDGITADAILGERLRMRNIPLAIQLLDWNHWLPDIHPLEGLPQLPPGDVAQVIDGVASAVPSELFEMGLYRHYDGAPVVDPSGVLPDRVSARERMEGATHDERCRFAEEELDRLSEDLRMVVATSPTVNNSTVATPEVIKNGKIVNATMRWFVIKRMELHREFELEDCGRVLHGEGADSRSWFGTLANAVPGVSGVPWEGAQNYDPRSPGIALDYASLSWWTQQIIVNTYPARDCSSPINWVPYFRSGFPHLGKDSGVSNMGWNLAVNTIGFQDVTWRGGEELTGCGPVGWEPDSRGSLDWLGDGSFAKLTRVWTEDGQIRPEGSFDPATPGLLRHDHAQIYGAYLQAYTRASSRVPVEAYHEPRSDYPGFGTFPYADPAYSGCTYSGCVSEPDWTDAHGVYHPDPVATGGFFERWSLAARLTEMLTHSRELFVDLQTRQALGDFAASIHPAIDWQSMVDDLGSRGWALGEGAYYPGVQVAIDPGAFPGGWYVHPSSEGSHVGPATVTMYPGQNSVVRDGFPDIRVLVYPDGTVVPYDTDQATGGLRTLELGATTVTLDPGAWRGWWTVGNVRNLRTYVVPTGMDHFIGIGRGWVSFRAEGDGTLSTGDPEAVAISGTTVTLRTRPVTFDVGAYAEGWGFEAGGPLQRTDAVLDLVPGVPYRLQFGSGGGFDLPIADDGTVLVPEGMPLVADGSRVWFAPALLTVTTAAPSWQTASGPTHAGSAVVPIQPTGAYQIWSGTGAAGSFSVDASCNVTPTTLTVSGNTFTFSCAPWEDPSLPTFYADLDGDGHGDAGTGSHRPLGRPGETEVGGDCDDTAVDISPSATETWYDGVDQDCSGGSDFDRDGDGSTSAGAPDGTGDDCDDLDGGVFAGAPEFCDGRVNGCSEDGSALVESGTATWFPAGGLAPVDVTAQLRGAPGAPVSWNLPANGEVAICDGTWYVTMFARTAVDVTLRGPHGAEATLLSPEGLNRGLLVTHSGARITLDGLTLTNGVSPTIDAVLNSSDCGGGGISLRAGTLTVRDSVITGNRACNAGGGILAGYSNPTLVVLDSSIDDNLGKLGVVIGTGTARFERSTIDGNVGGGFSANPASLVMVDTSVSFNLGPAEIGGVSVFNGLLERVVVEGNVGHGLWVGGSTTFVDGEIVNNAVSGVYMANGGGHLVLDGSVVQDNAVYGLYLRGGDVTCLGIPGEPAGFFRNRQGAASLNTHAANRLVADTCDFGVGVDDNPTNDLAAGPYRYEYGDDVTVTCTPTGCL